MCFRSKKAFTKFQRICFIGRQSLLHSNSRVFVEPTFPSLYLWMESITFLHTCKFWGNLFTPHVVFVLQKAKSTTQPSDDREGGRISKVMSAVPYQYTKLKGDSLVWHPQLLYSRFRWSTKIIFGTCIPVKTSFLQAHSVPILFYTITSNKTPFSLTIRFVNRLEEILFFFFLEDRWCSRDSLIPRKRDGRGSA